jgi:hypothetical protein
LEQIFSTWVKSMVDLNGKIHQLKCKICAKIDKEEKSLALSWIAFGDMVEGGRC